MEQVILSNILRSFTLNQRNINSQFRKETGLNTSNIELLTYANSITLFNPYEVQQYFKQMNLQQVRLSIRRLANIGAVEIVGRGKRGNAAVYMITKKGVELLNAYANCWQTYLVN